MTKLIKKTILAAPIVAIATLGFASTAFAATPSVVVSKHIVHVTPNVLTTGTHLKRSPKIANFVSKATPRRSFFTPKRVIKSYTPIYKVKPKYGKSYNYGYKSIYGSKLKPFGIVTF